MTQPKLLSCPRGRFPQQGLSLVIPAAIPEDHAKAAHRNENIRVVGSQLGALGLQHLSEQWLGLVIPAAPPVEYGEVIHTFERKGVVGAQPVAGSLQRL